MIKATYVIEINAPKAKVYQVMLEKEGYEQWTSAFGPTSSYIGNWEKGSKMYFTAIGEDGKIGGMISVISENIPNEFVSICHKGMLDGDIEIMEGPTVDDWVNASENYTFTELENGTHLQINIDITDQYKDYFDETYPKALNILKQICEK